MLVGCVVVVHVLLDTFDMRMISVGRCSLPFILSSWCAVVLLVVDCVKFGSMCLFVLGCGRLVVCVSSWVWFQ